MQAERKKHEEEQLLEHLPFMLSSIIVVPSEDLVKEAKRRAQASFRLLLVASPVDCARSGKT